MKNQLRILLEEFLPEELIEPIVAKAKELGLSLKIKKFKGRKRNEIFSKLVKERGNKCEQCNAVDKKITIDHIIPKKILLDMGLEEYFDDESNLSLLCTDCNSIKGSQLDFSNTKTIVLLQKYIDIYNSRRTK